MESRKCKVLIRKAGGTAGKNSVRYTVDLPSKWANEMKVSQEKRDVLLSFDGSVVTIRKVDGEVPEERKEG